MAQNEFTVAVAHAIPGAEQLEQLIEALPELDGHHAADTGNATPDAGDMGKDSAAVHALAEQLQHGQDQIASTIAQSGANWDVAMAQLNHQDPAAAPDHDAFHGAGFDC